MDQTKTLKYCHWHQLKWFHHINLTVTSTATSTLILSHHTLYLMKCLYENVKSIHYEKVSAASKCPKCMGYWIIC